MILALLATLGAIVTAFVLYPVLSHAPAGGLAALNESERELANLNDKKAMLYEAIQELEFEKDSGKISESEHEATRNEYLAQVATVMQQIDAIAPEPAPTTKAKPDETKKKTLAPSNPKSALECASCGETNPKGSKYCLECGTAFARACSSCGESLPAKARFCNACGEKVSG